MDELEPPEFLARIEERLTTLGMSEREASVSAFGHHKAFHNLRKHRSPGIDTFQRLAPVLRTSAAYLAFGIDAAGQTVAPVRAHRPGALPVIGEVAAGQWLEVDTVIDAPPQTGAALAADPRWPVAAQYAVVVRGTSINRVAPDGAILACVDTRAIRYRARGGDLLIVQRTKNGGHDVERTAKRYRENGERFELWPDSTDPRHKPIIIDPSEGDEGTTVEIIGLVTRYMHAVTPGEPWGSETARIEG